MGNKTAWGDAIIGINEVQLDRMERDLLKDINWEQIIYKDHNWPQLLWHGTSYTLTEFPYQKYVYEKK